MLILAQLVGMRYPHFRTTTEIFIAVYLSGIEQTRGRDQGICDGLCRSESHAISIRYVHKSVEVEICRFTQLTLHMDLR